MTSHFPTIDVMNAEPRKLRRCYLFLSTWGTLIATPAARIDALVKLLHADPETARCQVFRFDNNGGDWDRMCAAGRKHRLGIK